MGVGLVGAEVETSKSVSPGRAYYVGLLCILFVFAVTVVGYNISIPIGEAPDEPAHVQNVQVILQTGQLPTIPLGSSRYSYEAEQPPLYYLLEAAWIKLIWPGQPESLLPELHTNPTFDPDHNFAFGDGSVPNQYLIDYSADDALPVHLMRLLSLLCGLATILLVWKAARLAWPDHPGSALAAAGFVSVIPGFAFSSATVNNDALAATAGAALLLVCVYMLKNGVSSRVAVVAGVVMGLGLLSKRSLLVLLPVVVVVAVLAARRNSDATQAGSWRRASVVAALVVAAALMVGVWPFVSNLVEYGDPMATAVTAAAKSEIVSPLEGRPGFWLSPAYFIAIFNSFWGSFGIRNVDLPNILYAGYYVLCMLAVIAIVRFRKSLERVEGWVLWLCLLVFVIVNVGVAYQNTQFWAVQGRLLLPALAAVALPVGRGLAILGSEFLPKGQARFAALYVLLGGLVLVNWYALIVYVIRAYYGS